MTPENARAIRKKLNFTGSEMAAAIGVGSQTRISEYETGKRGISGATRSLYIVYRDNPEIAIKMLAEAKADAAP